MRRIIDFSNILSAFFDLCACFEFLSRHVSVRLCGDSMVSHLSGFTLKADGNFELFFIFVLTTKLNLAKCELIVRPEVVELLDRERLPPE
jgi:hypothetical protein